MIKKQHTINFDTTSSSKLRFSWFPYTVVTNIFLAQQHLLWLFQLIDQHHCLPERSAGQAATRQAHNLPTKHLKNITCWLISCTSNWKSYFKQGMCVSRTGKSSSNLGKCCHRLHKWFVLLVCGDWCFNCFIGSLSLLVWKNSEYE